MIIGLCGGGFPDVRRMLQAALPSVELVDLPAASAVDGLPRVDVLIPLGATVDAALMDAVRPRLIQQFGVGLQGVDRAAARARQIPVTYVPAAVTGNATAVAEIVFIHLLSLLRGYLAAQHNVAKQQVGQPIGTSLSGKAVTVLGTGAIGTAVVRRLSAFGAVPMAVGRRDLAAYPDLAELLPPERYYPTADLVTALAQSTVLVICCPLTDETHGLIGTEQLAAMPRGGYLINVGRGPVVNYQALLDALCSGQLAGAGLDVTWSEPIDPTDDLLGHNVTVTPHIGGVTHESYIAMAETFAANLRKLQADEPLDHLAD